MNKTCICCHTSQLKQVAQLKPATMNCIFDIYECQNCNVVQSIPHTTEMFDYSSFYLGQYHYSEYRNQKTITDYHQQILTACQDIYKEEILKMLRFKPDSKTILEVGCGIPFFLYFTKQLGLEATGLDVVSSIMDYSEHVFGIRIINSLIDQAHLPPGSFDIIRYHHVFEHLLDPVSELNHLSKIIKPHGLLMISIPNRYCWKTVIKRYCKFKNKSFYVDPPHHFFGYSLKSIISLMYHFQFHLIHSYSTSNFSLPGERNFKKSFLHFIDTKFIPYRYQANLNLIFHYNA